MPFGKYRNIATAKRQNFGGATVQAASRAEAIEAAREVLGKHFASGRIISAGVVRQKTNTN